MIMNNYIFYHCAVINDYYKRFLNTLEKIKTSGLINKVDNIFVIVNGQSDLNFNLDKKIVATTTNYLHPNESITINRLRDFSINNKNSNILYLHSKGVTRSNSESVCSWIAVMEHFVISRYEDCLNDLKNFDAVGCLLKQRPQLHFSGNFWWATSNYISKLPECRDEYMAPEMWHLSGTTEKNVKCYFNSDKYLYSEQLNKNEYEF